MNQYLIFTPRVSSLGGAQLYTLRRAKHLKEKGNLVSVIVFDVEGDFILKEQFKGIDIFHFPYLKKPCYSLNDNRNKIIKSLKKIVKNSEVFIETHTLELAVWGEFMAERLNGKNIIYLLDTVDLKKSPYFKNKQFLWFKLERNEIIGISERFLPILFKREIDNNNYVNIGFDKTELVEESIGKFNRNNFSKDTFIIGTIGRLEKKYIEPLIKTLISLAQEVNKKFCLIIIGDSIDPKIKIQLTNKYIDSAPKNLEIIFTGYINPIGKDFFRTIDVFVGQGTSVVNASSQGCATLVLETNDEYCNGFFGIDTNSFGYSDQKEHYLIKDKLKLVIQNFYYKQLCEKEALNLYNDAFDLQSCFNKMDKIVFTALKKEYFQKKDFFIELKNFVVYMGINVFLSIKHRKVYNG